MSKKILLVDGSPLMYQAYSVMHHFSTKSGEKTGVRFGFIRSLRKWKEDFQADKVVIVWDSKTVKKAEGSPGYKANRTWTKDKEAMYAQLPDLKKLLSLTGFTQAEKEGYEADDILATIAREMETQGVEVTIATADADLLAVSSGKVQVFLTGVKKVQTPEEYYGVPARTVTMMKVLLGDTSDNVGSMVGNRAAVISWLKGPEMVNAPLDEQISMALKKWNLESGIGLRVQLMRLHDVQDIEFTKGENDSKKLEEEFQRLEFKSMMKFIPQFLVC